LNKKPKKGKKGKTSKVKLESVFGSRGGGPWMKGKGGGRGGTFGNVGEGKSGVTLPSPNDF